MDLNDPDNIKREIIYYPDEKRYVIVQTVGSVNYRTPLTMTFDEFIETEFRKNERSYLKEKSDVQSYLGRKRKQTFVNKDFGNQYCQKT